MRSGCLPWLFNLVKIGVFKIGNGDMCRMNNATLIYENFKNIEV